MRRHFRHSGSIVALTLSSSEFSVGIEFGSYGPVSYGREPILQLGGGPHVAAAVGIIGLALLGGFLAIRNRLEKGESIGNDREPDQEEFITDRERVRQLINENGGRMKQSRIVDSVDWSKAKVSRLLAELEEEGKVTKLRLGRENLVCLPDHEPTASKSREQPQNE
ncbi:hypothetical protein CHINAEXTREME_16610 [Halobiforma lacisalsi AJ5]|uniref:DUF7343 domain-containing protein n=2 Tax=Natronobacterium TaxID=2256 RepID=M0LEJ9_NATLA|nr:MULTISPECIES: helix-turn-helix domain-containing protein [Halobiforma]APW99293.1 hypothetical protein CHINAEXTREME_16610 [Halobiforma lacisalsi AJ5]EMA30869.1 hypothetical protein C445_16221 [Halobiforma lacisalsi AJ5]SFB93395.1 IclR helix-turn-helix domain-containing protein [Halobiforma haloterrestris]